MNDTNLKILLAKMLPETVREWGNSHPPTVLLWNSNNAEVLDTELLHICDLIERKIRGRKKRDYEDALAKFSDGFILVRYTWQQRVTALAAVKGVTL